MSLGACRRTCSPSMLGSRDASAAGPFAEAEPTRAQTSAVQPSATIASPCVRFRDMEFPFLSFTDGSVSVSTPDTLREPLRTRQAIIAAARTTIRELHSNLLYGVPVPGLKCGIRPG